MQHKRFFFLFLLFVPFSIVSGIAVFQYGYLELWKLPFSNIAIFQIFFDLFNAVFLICCWMIQDAKSRNKPIWYWLIFVVLTGTFAILVYLICREWQKRIQ